MTVLITLTTAGADSGPFNLYSNIDGYASAFEIGVSKSALLAGYPSALVPDYTTIIRIVSTGDCTNYIDIPLSEYTTTTTTTTATVSTFCYNGLWELDDPAHPGGGSVTYINSLGIEITIDNIWIGEPVSIDALSIINTIGVDAVYCCGSYELFGGVSGATYSFTDCSTGLPVTVVIPAGDSVSVCHAIPYPPGQYLDNCIFASTTTTTTTISPIIACIQYTISTNSGSGQTYTYTDCFGNPDQSGTIGGVSGFDSNTFCAEENSVIGTGQTTTSYDGPCPV